MKRIQLIGTLMLLMLSMLACNAGDNGRPSETPPPGEKIDQTTLEPAAITETATNPPAAEAAGECDNPYMPVVVGATWNYALTGPTSDTFTHTILAMEDAGFTEQDIFGVGVTRQGKWTCEDGNLTALNPSSGTSGTVQAENVQVNLETTELTGVTLPAAINAGDTWSQALTLEGTETINGQEYPARNQLTSDCESTGVEPVTVQAGTFDAMKVECHIVMKITITVGGADTGTTIDLTGTSWYAENVGLVKNVTIGMGLDSTTELVSYNIAQ